MNNPLSHVGQTAHTEGASAQSTSSTGRAVIGVHLGVRFQVEALARGRLFQGRFTLLEDGSRRDSGSDDSHRPTTHNSWATEAEALTYATEAAHHAIEGIAPSHAGAPSGG